MAEQDGPTERLPQFGLERGTLLPHQAENVRRLYATPRALLNDKPGLGKTVSAGGLIFAVRSEGDDRPIVWLVNSTALARQVHSEIERFLPSLRVIDSTEKRFANPSKKQKDQLLAEPPDVLVVTYQTATSRLEWLCDRGPFSLVIADEISEIRGGKKLAEATRALSAKATRAVGLTASPLENDPLETYELLVALDIPGLWDRETFESFLHKERGYRHGKTGEWVPEKVLGVQPQYFEHVRSTLSRYCFGVTHEQAGVTMPTRVGDDVIWVPLDGIQQWAYEKANERSSPLERAKQQDRAGLYAGKKGQERSVLVEAMVRWLTSRPDVDKAIVWAENYRQLDIAERELRAAGIRYVRVDGGLGNDDRATAIEDFRSVPAIRVLLGTRVLERGLNLQFCRVLLSLGSTHNPQRDVQREGRIARIGGHPTYEHVMFLPDTERERNRDADRRRKVTLAESLFGRTPTIPCTSRRTASAPPFCPDHGIVLSDDDHLSCPYATA